MISIGVNIDNEVIGDNDFQVVNSFFVECQSKVGVYISKMEQNLVMKKHIYQTEILSTAVQFHLVHML